MPDDVLHWSFLFAVAAGFFYLCGLAIYERHQRKAKRRKTEKRFIVGYDYSPRRWR